MHRSQFVSAALIAGGITATVYAQASFYALDAGTRLHGISLDGSAAAGDDNLRAVRWTRVAGTVVVFDPSVPGLARALSRDGKIVAGSMKAGAVRGSECDWLRLGVLPNTGESYALDVNGRGDMIVGECLKPDYYCDKLHCYVVDYILGKAFYWTPQGGMQDLGYLPGADPGSAFASAEAVASLSAVVVGSSSSAEGTQAFRWKLGQMSGLGDLPGGAFYSFAKDVSADGSVVVGTGSTADGRRAFRWIPNQGMASIGVLPEKQSSDAYAVSADGRLVAGESSDNAFIWSSEKGMRDLRGLLVSRGTSIPEGWSFQRVESMSGDGRSLAGIGGDATGTRGFVAYLETTHRASVSQTEAPANADSGGGSISANGELIAFSSDATNLVPGDTNGATDIFVRNRAAGWTARDSVGQGGAQANGASTAARITPDGRFVVFASVASNLVAGDTNAAKDIFIRDRVAGTTTRVSLSTGGGQGNGASDQPQITADGRYVVFQSLATNLVAGDTNGVSDVFLRDRQTGQTIRMSVNTAGQQGNDASTGASISNSGLAIVFTSAATNLAPGDTNKRRDVFLRNRYTGQTEILTKSHAGYPSNGDSYGARIAGDGRYVALTSEASNLVITQPQGPNAYVWDRSAFKMTLVSVPNSLIDGAVAPSTLAAISADGRYVLFSSQSGRMTWADTNGRWDAFVRNMVTQETWRISIGTASEQGDADAFGGSLSPDGKWATFTTESSGLTADDDDGLNDVFVRSLFEP